MSVRTRVTIAVIAAALALGVVGSYAAWRVSAWHDLGMTGIIFFPEPPPQQKTPSIEFMKPGRVFMIYATSPAVRAGIHTGDQLLTINGISVKDNKTLMAKARDLRAGDVVTYRLQRAGRTLEFRVPLVSPLHIPLFLAACIVTMLVAAAYLAIALLVLIKRPDDRRVLVFYAMMIVGALYLLGTPAFSLESSDLRGLYAEQSGRGLLAAITMFAVFIAFLPLTLHLALVFPRDRPILRSSPHVLRWVYGVPAALVIVLALLGVLATVINTAPEQARQLDLPLNVLSGAWALAAMLIAWRIVRITRGENVRDAFWQRPVQTIIVVVGALLGLARVADATGVKWLEILAAAFLGILPVVALASFPILSIISLYRSYRDAGAEERRQVKWPLWGLVIALSARMIVNVGAQAITFITMFRGGDFGRAVAIAQIIGTFSVLVYLLIPISFAVAIFKYRLMNIDVIIRKTVVYAALSGAIVIVYLATVGILGTLLVRFTGVQNQTMVIGATLVVALVFVPMRNKLQKIVERTLFRHRYDYPDALRAIAADALTASDAALFLAHCAERTQQALQNRAVMIFTARHDEFVAAGKVGVADSLLGTLRIPRRTIEPLLRAPFDPRQHESVGILRRIEAVLVVPVNTPGTPANGFIALAPKLTGGAFEAEDVEFLRGVADQLDIGLDRIRLQREDADYSQARAIQQTLIPREMPRVAGLDLSGMWQPARTMGGDYYDLLKLSEHELAVCIGDVAGKGMPAALLMSGLQAAVRASASNSPRDLCERVRRVVVSSLSGGRFVTFFYATIDAAAMTLRWTNAGHNAPILARADGSIVRLSEGGPAISRLFRDAYEEREIALVRGDRIVLFTDGVSEASDGAGGQFGEERIEEIVRSMPDASAADVQQAIVSEAIAFAGGEVEDDLTLVVVTLPA